MNKSELIDSIVDKSGLSKIDANRALDATVQCIIDALKNDDSVAIIGFGTFAVKHKDARMVHNPRTGEQFMSSPKKSPAFKPGKALKDALN